MKRIISFSFIIAGIMIINSCSDDINLDNINESDYNNVSELIGTLRDLNTGKTSNMLEIRNSDYVTSVSFCLSRPPEKGVDVCVSYDSDYIKEYNSEHGTSFDLYPSDKIKIQNDGEIVVAPDEVKSYSLNVMIEKGDTTNLKNGKTYLIPLKVVSKTEGIKVSESESHCVYLVKNCAGENDADKGEDAVKNFLYFEVNDTNPLNALLFEREDGKLLFDFVVLFAANINYDSQKGEVYIYNNPNVQFLLDNDDEYLQPLRKRGIKVILGLLGNHDESGLAQLSDIGARDFAKKIADLCYSYKLDGVNFDDEYSKGPDLSNPLFTNHSVSAGSRLIFETKKAMPDKYVTIYQYGDMRGSDYVDNISANNWLDIAVADYGSAAYPLMGMTIKNCSGNSTEMSRGGYISMSDAQRVRNRGYGYYMIFSLWSADHINSSQVNAMNNLSKGLYDMPLKPITSYYPKNSLVLSDLQ